VPADTQVPAGPEMRGIPVVTALARHTGLPCAFVRKRAKEYGTRRPAEGTDVVGRRVLVGEDVVTTGGRSSRRAANCGHRAPTSGRHCASSTADRAARGRSPRLSRACCRC
jgi:orotate phosphoribosyltransferase